MVVPGALGTSELVGHLRLRLNPGAWSVVLVPAGQGAAASKLISQELAAVFDAQSEVKYARSVEEVVKHVGPAKPDALTLVYGLDEFDDAAWSQLDRLRSSLVSEGAIVVVLSEESFSRLSRNASNLASWIGSSLWYWDESGDRLSAGEKESRLQALRARFSMTDDQVRSAAAAGHVPPEPEFAEWLVLLDQGDLLDRE